MFERSKHHDKADNWFGPKSFMLHRWYDSDGYTVYHIYRNNETTYFARTFTIGSKLEISIDGEWKDFNPARIVCDNTLGGKA